MLGAKHEGSKIEVQYYILNIILKLFFFQIKLMINCVKTKNILV